MGEPATLARGKDEECEQADREQRRAVFGEAREAEEESAAEPEPPDRAGAGPGEEQPGEGGAAAARQNSSGPSGTTQPPAETRKNAVALTQKTARTPAAAPNRSRVRAKISQPVAANSAMNGSRIAGPSPTSRAVKWASH